MQLSRVSSELRWLRAAKELRIDIIYIKKLKTLILLEEVCNLISKIQGVLPVSHGVRCEGRVARVPKGAM